MASFRLEREQYDVALACFLLARNIFDEVQSPNRSVPQRSIEACARRMGETAFAALLIQVELQARHMVEQALREGWQTGDEEA